MSRKLVAEFIGTFWLVLGGCGSAVLAAGVPNVGIGYAGVALAFGLTVVTGAYAFGHISGAHFNPAVTLGLCGCRTLPGRDIVPYWIAQVAGANRGRRGALRDRKRRGRLRCIAGFASNGYGEHSPQGYSLLSGAHLRSRDDLHVPARHSGRRRRRSAPAGFRAARHRACADADPSHFDSR